MIPRNEIAYLLSPIAPVPTGLSPSGRLTGPVRSVLFDVYGTLFVSGSGDLGAARRRAQTADIGALLEKYGISEPPQAVAEAFHRQIEASHARSRAAGVDVPEVEYDRIWMAVLATRDRDYARRFAVQYELIVNPVYPMPGLGPMLEGLGEKKLALGLVSNAQFFTPWLFSWFLGETPEALGFEGDLQILSYRLGMAKPSRALFDAAAAALSKRGIAPAAALFVGNDMRNDVAAAQQAGFQTALFAGDTRSLRLRQEADECRDIAPDLVVTELAQLLELV